MVSSSKKSPRLKVVPERRVVAAGHFSSPAGRFSKELSAQHRVTVRILGARKLCASDPVSGTCDASAAVWCSRIDDVSQGKDAMQRTAPCLGTTEPRWNDEFCFAVAVEDPADLQAGCIVVAVRDEQMEAGRVDLGEATLAFVDVFRRGRLMPSTRTVHLTARWLELTGVGRVSGAVLVSTVFFFARDVSRRAFEAAVVRLADIAVGTEETTPLEEEAPLHGSRSMRPSPRPFDVATTPLVDMRSPRLATPRLALNRLHRAGRLAERSLLVRPESMDLLRNRVRDALAGLRDRDSRATAAGMLWAELRGADDAIALVLLDEVLAARHTARVGGMASAVLVDEAAPNAARRHCLALVAEIASMHARACAPRLTAVLRAIGIAAQTVRSNVAEECYDVAGLVVRQLAPHLRRSVAKALIDAWTPLLSRPNARSRRAIAACVAALLSNAGKGPRAVWLARPYAARSSTSGVAALMRHLAARGFPATAMPTLDGAVVHCDGAAAARQLRDDFAADAEGWHLDEGVCSSDEPDERTFAIAVRRSHDCMSSRHCAGRARRCRARSLAGRRMPTSHRRSGSLVSRGARFRGPSKRIRRRIVC